MRFATLLYFGVFAAAVIWSPASAQDGDDSLRLYAVHVNRTPKQSWTGYGVYLGRGIVITAAHVVGFALWTKPRVEIAGKDLPATVLKEGSFDNVDLTLLSVDERELPVSLQLRRMPICQNSPWVGEPIIVATPESVARSIVMSPRLLPPGIRAKFNTVIRYVAETGNSGSGVFDANRNCLLGIISRKISGNQIRQENGHAIAKPYDLAKYFVSASAIVEFIPPDVRF
jgi:hypothetical protein